MDYKDIDKLINEKIGTENIGVGSHVVSVGYGMDCLPCICYGFIERQNEDGSYCYYSKCDGIRIRFENLDDLWTDTPQHRNIVKSACQQYIDEWKAAVRKQLEKFSRN